MAARLATVAEVLAYVAAFSAIDPEPLTAIVSATGSMINLEAWGVKAQAGHMNLAAHFGSKALAGAGGASASGPVTSRTIDKLSTSYASPTFEATDGDLGSTSYGQLYLMLRRSLVIVPIVSDPPAFYARGRG